MKLQDGGEICAMRTFIRKMRWAGHIARMRTKRNTYRFLMEKPEGRRPLGRHRHRWEDNTKMDLREIE
jgi:hypothetical protein